MGQEHSDENPQLWSTEDDELLIRRPPPTAQALATPKRVPQRRGSRDQESNGGLGYGPPDEGTAGSGHISPKFKIEASEVRGSGNKADTGDLLGLHAGQASFGPKSGHPGAFRSFSKNGLDGESNFGGVLKFKNTKSSSIVSSSPDAESAAGDGWSKKPTNAAYAALRYLGLLPGNSKSPTSKPAALRASTVVGHLLEFALAICFASAADCRALAEAATPEDKKALFRLRELAERKNLLGRGVVVGESTDDATLSPAELVFAFLDSAANSRPSGYSRKGSASSVSGPFNYRANSRVRFDESPRGENRTEFRRQGSAAASAFSGSPGQSHLPRQDSLASSPSSALLSPGGRRGGFGRSQSDFSYTSFADFNRKQEGEAEPDLPDMPDTASPAFLEFLMVVLKGQDMRTSGDPLPLTSKGVNGTDLVLDLKLSEGGFIRQGSTLNADDDTSSALTYHSYCDAMLGGEGEEKETISAEIAKLGGAEGKQTVRIAFKSKCLRTQNAWQRQLLAQQRALLDVVAGKLKAAEKTLKADEEVKEEERELLRGFRKIVRREQGAEDVQAPVEIFVVEKAQKLRAETEELCRILSYPCQSYNSFSTAMEAVAQASQSTVQRVVSMMSRNSGKSTDLLDGRPGGSLPDWRCRALCTTGRNAGNVMLETPTQIVLLGMAWLSRGLPSEWQQQGVYVVLITEAGDFEDVGRQLLASGEAEMREKLRARGICDYLIHPLSLDSLSTVISQAQERRLEEYLLLDILGRGATACVHKAKRLRDNETLALKEINMRRLRKFATEGIDRELRLLRELSWPTVVFTLDTWENEKEKLRYVVMPVLDGGSLLQRIEAAREGKGAEGEEVQYSVDRVADWYVQTFHGLSYLHWRGVIHRDIKPGNLLIGQDGRLLQLGDLGSAMLLPGTGPFPNSHAKVIAPVTSPSYASPEALLQETHLAASDVWCVGASFFEVLTLHPLFPDVQSMVEAQEHVRAFDPSMAAPTNGATNYAVAALSTLNQLRCSSSSSAAAVELATELPELVRPDFMQRPTAASIASRYFCMKRVKTVLKETGAVPKGMVSTHIEDYKTVLKQSQAAKNVTADAAGVSPVESPVARGRRR
ncbi:unnamed protein product [Effrenium voratum]|nr:unnamed protein product [Effrenium voratum]